MQIVDPEQIFTIEGIGKHLQLSDLSPITMAVKKGELPALVIGSETRIVGKDLNDYLFARRTGGMPNAKGSSGTNGSSQWHAAELKLKNGASFVHKWPDGTKEKYRDVLEGTVNTSNGTLAVKIGFTSREAAGKERERATVFLDGRPYVQFCGADDYSHSKVLASIIKVDGKQIRPFQGIPDKYRHLKVEPYNHFVTGPRAFSNLAVHCTKDDSRAMVEHALIRLEESES